MTENTPSADSYGADEPLSDDAYGWADGASAGHPTYPFYRPDVTFGSDVTPDLRADIEFMLWLKDEVRALRFPVWRALVYEQARRGAPYADLVILACARVKAAMPPQRIAEHVLTDAALGACGVPASGDRPRLRVVGG